MEDECCFVDFCVNDGCVPGKVLDEECWLLDFCFDDTCVVGLGIDNICVVGFGLGLVDT